MQEQLSDLYRKVFGAAPEQVEPIVAHASRRSMFRMQSAGRSVIGVSGDLIGQNRAFLGFTRHFKKFGLPVAEICAVSDDETHHLVEDLGSETLMDLLQRDKRTGSGELSAEVQAYYEKAVAMLPHFQIRAGASMDFSPCHQSQSFDREAMLRDMHFFRDSFARQCRWISFDTEDLGQDFVRFADLLSSAASGYFLYRDFQARNIIVRPNNGGLAFIDYQEGRRGPLQYDLVSLLYQSKGELTPEFRKNLMNHYLDAAGEFVTINREQFIESYHGFIFMRIMRVLGTYGEQGLKGKKDYFRQSIPLALTNLSKLLDTVALPIELPTLTELFRELIDSGAQPKETRVGPELNVNVRSFSYRNGIPQSEDEHGVGFVFDCRCISNPGREEEYKELTGLDQSVKDYIRARHESHAFFRRVAAIVDQAVDSYRSRGFDRLTVNFGCTGGRHRSVYFTELMAKHLRERQDVKVSARHLNLEALGIVAPPEKEEQPVTMRAMILAAGLGTRLGEITKTTPKCLVTVAGKPLLQHAIEAVAGLGITDIAVNLHHHADQVRAFLQQLSGQNLFGQRLRFHLEYENELLDTGGGVLNCRAFLAEADHFIVHNADIFSEISLQKLYDEHLARANTATMAVKHRESSRGLLFDRNGELRGKYGPKGEVILPGEWGTLDRCAFGGISIGSRGFLEDLAHYSGAFSIIDGFLTASQNGHRAGAFITDDYYWVDVGTPEKLAAVNEYVAGRAK